MEEHPEARYIVETLGKAGFIAYYAGGWVRDFLLQHPSDDIDIATNAPPETIQALFPHTIPIGIAFGIVLVMIEERSYEVATFRQDFDYKDGRRPSRIAFSTAEEDAKRRDFTINGMFYDPLTQTIHDYVGGQEDLKLKIIRAIGDPHQRIQEDRLRMIRAIRLSCRLQFSIEPKTQEAIHAHAKELYPAVAIERIVQEMEKGKKFHHLQKMLLLLHEYRLLESIFPNLKDTSIQTCVKPLSLYPEKAPLIAYLSALFPKKNLPELLDLCKMLKLSNQEQQFIRILFQAKSMIHSAHSLFEWAHFYAHPSAWICLQIISADFEENERILFLKAHEKQIKRLARSIERIKEHAPTVRAEDLLKEGVKPGPLMGHLLKKAQEISIDEQIEDPQLIIQKLKQLPDWNSEDG